MIYLKTNPVGIDIVINDIQLAVANAIGFPTDYNAYHRAYKNESSKGIVPEIYKAQTQNKVGEYKEVFLDDNISSSSFFYVEDILPTTDNGNMVTPTISMVFQVDLVDVTNVKDSREDEQIKRDVVNAINGSGVGKVDTIVSGISNTYTEFDTSQLNWDDLQPYLVFRVDISTSFQYSCIDVTQPTINDIGGNPVIMF